MSSRGRYHPGGSSGFACGAVLLLAAFLAAGGVSADAGHPVDRLVRQVYFEALPYAEVGALGPGAAERLLALLHDPEEAEFHANVILTLGILSAPGTYEALLVWAQGLAGGEVDRAGFRARRVLPHAMGHLARADARALAWLAQHAGRSAVPTWSFGVLRDERLASLQRGAAVQGLALSGQPAARAELERLAGHPDVAADARLARSVREALAWHAAVSRHGVEAALPRRGATR
jgi:hypothetical protein